MELNELKKIAVKGESYKLQFKETINSADQLAAEMVAFSNANGGTILIGVSDSRKIIGIDNNEINKFNQLISNTATNNIFAPVFPVTENIEVSEKKVVIAIHIFEGIHKPYCDKNRIYWIKNGADKRKALPGDIHQLMQSSKKISPLELNIRNSYIDNFNLIKYKEFYAFEYGELFPKKNIDMIKILNNKQLFVKNEVSLLGGLTFCKVKSFTTPSFCVKAVSFIGNNSSATEYRDSEDYYGPIDYLFNSGINFIVRNLHKIQNSKSVNTLGSLEISKIVFEELLVNAIIHKDYSYETPVKILIFDNRIEIINGGAFVEGISVNSAKKGNAKPRNSLLVYYASKLLSYRGLGKGIKRAYDAYKNIEIFNNTDLNQVKCIIKRKKHATPHATRHATRHAIYDESLYLNNLTEKQVVLLRFCVIPKSRNEIALKTKMNEKYLRNKLLKKLIDLDLISATVLDKPKSPNQKYITTDKGKRILRNYE